MKKTALALFSVSITAGTAYLIYDRMKTYYINRIASTWSLIAENKGKVLDKTGLSNELRHFYPWDLRLLAMYADPIRRSEMPEETQGLLEKIRDRKILDQMKESTIEAFAARYMSDRIGNAKTID